MNSDWTPCSGVLPRYQSMERTSQGSVQTPPLLPKDPTTCVSGHMNKLEKGDK